MRDIATKADGSSTLTAAEFNSYMVELENSVTRSGQTLDSGAGPDTDSFQLARAVLLHALAGQSYQDNGAANTFVLAAIQGYQQPAAYFGGMTVRFKAAATNTGACTINVGGLGAISFTLAGGAAFTAGLIGAGNIVTAQYFSGTNRFEEVANTTPDLSGPAAPDQIAIYADSGSPTGIVLTIEPGYVQPSAFTDQMAVLFKANATNNGTDTHQINVTGLGTRDVVEQDGTDPAQGRMPAGSWVLAVFREVRNEFEIAFVYDKPQPDVALPCTISSSSGTNFNLATLAQSRAPAAYLDGMVVIFRAPQTNTGSLNINLNGLGAKSLRNTGGATFAPGEVPSGDMVIAQYVLSEDRFRAFVATDHPTPKTLESGRGIRYDLITNSPLPANTQGNPTWGNIAFDDLGFNNGGNPTIPSGQGIDRVDIIGTFNPSLANGDDLSIVLRKNNVPISGHSVFDGAGSNFFNVVALDVPVTAGDDFDFITDLDSSSSKNITGSFVLRVSKFAAS